jgi:hypothetical protein
MLFFNSHFWDAASFCYSIQLTCVPLSMIINLMNFSSDSTCCKRSVPIFGWFSFCSVTRCHGVNSSYSCQMSRFSKLWHDSTDI